VTGQNASQVAAGQSVTLTFFQLPSGAGQGGFGQGSPRPSVTPSAGSGGQGFFGQGGQGSFRGGKTAQGTVASVQPGSNGSVTAMIAIVKLPSGVTAKYTGTAQIQVKVLASNVLVIPRAAIKGGGGNATVQVLVNGKTSTRSVTVGQQTQTDSEITSGLSAGDSIVYTRTFTGRFPGSGNGQSGGQGFPQNGTPPSGVPSGAPFGASQPGP
jgi:multidrug efflux pump subunit AcrA (membrane-fusion protein)